jgi:NADPH-dependent F420 reductase
VASDQPTIAIIGGTGDLGTGLARLWADAGFAIVLGSRDGTKAHAAAEALDAGRLRVRGTDNISAAKAGEIVVLAVPYASHDATLAELKPVLTGKILVDAVVPLVPPKVSVVQLPAEGSAAVIAARILGEGVRVVSAFHNVGARKLHAGQKADCDVLVFGDDKDARDTVLGLARHIATGAVDGGVLANSAAAEALTSVLIGINRRYKIDGAGLRFTGLPVPA